MEPVKSYWAVAQTVSNMEHIVRREIEKTNHAAFLPTYARRWAIDGVEYAKERPLLTGYVFFNTSGDDWAGLPDIHGVYQIILNPDGTPRKVRDAEMERLVRAHLSGENDKVDEPRYTRYYRAPVAVKKQARRRQRPRRSRQFRMNTDQCST